MGNAIRTRRAARLGAIACGAVGAGAASGIAPAARTAQDPVDRAVPNASTRLLDCERIALGRGGDGEGIGGGVFDGRSTERRRRARAGRAGFPPHRDDLKHAFKL